MAMNGKVRPDCNYASNPYHECTDICLKRIAEGKGRKDKKKSDSGILFKKSEEKKGNKGCPRASNPYHECNENCFKGAGAGREAYKPPGPANEMKLEGKRKMDEARPTPPREIYQNDNNISDVSMPLASFFTSEKQNGEHYSSEIQVEESSLDSNHAHSSRPLPTSVVPSKTEYSQELTKDSAKKQNGDHHHHNNNNNDHHVASASRSFSFSGVEGSDDDDDTRSEMSDSSVSVGKYRVKGRLSPILQSIFDKYGDIGATCLLESVAMRSYYLECVCFVVQELQLTQPSNARPSKFKEMMAILKDVEVSGINVSWLRKVLNENFKLIEKMEKCKEIEDSIASCDKEITSAREKLESEMASLALIEEEANKVKKRIEETKAHLKELERKSSNLNETLSSIKSKFENGKSLLDGVL